jgi:glycosyltransferase involved in cell wall biosynthesis
MASRWMYRPLLARLARWDAATSTRVHRFVANSTYVAKRIRRYYDRESVVVYPPVDTDFFRPSAFGPGDHLLVVSALVPYKRIDRAIEACVAAGVPLRIVGDGPDRTRLERRAGPGVSFLGHQPDEALREEYQRARATILAGEEDFGMVPVEAQACGRPVIAFARGGALETVYDGDTGLLFDEPSAQSLAGAIARLDTHSFSTARIREHAEAFSRQRHLDGLKAVVDATVTQAPGTRW